ncbi:MAG: anthranilate phosphoribosyltransferase, partial [Desulfotignum sp.]
PLTNPARANRQVLGVYRADLVEKLAEVLFSLGCRQGFVVHGHDGMDEITLTGATTIAAIDSSGVTLSTITPEQFGLTSCVLADLQGGDAPRNAQIVRAILSGTPGAQRDIVLLNSAYALLAAGSVATVPDGITMAAQAIDSGRAAEVLAELVRMTNA